MEENTTIQKKIQNALVNLKQQMQADRRIFLGVIGVGVLVGIFLVVAVFSFSRKEDQELQIAETPFSTGVSQKRRSSSKPKIPATLSLVAADPKKIYKVNDIITLTVIGDTGGQQIRGYDVGFKFDPTKVSFASEKNLLPKMQYIRRIRGKWVILTATQPLEATNSLTLSKTKLMEVTFKATASGNAYFPLSYIPDSFNDSNLISTSSNDILTNVAGIVIRIQP